MPSRRDARCHRSASTSRSPAGPLASAPACVSRDNCAPPLRGGLNISPIAGRCTSGFVTRDIDEPTSYYLLTAGHCSEFPNEEFLHNGQPIGNRVANALADGSPLDALLIAISPTNASNLVYTRFSNSGYRISSSQELDTDMVDQVVCTSSAYLDNREGARCGFLQHTDWTFTDEDGSNPHQRAADIPVADGDSGAAVFMNPGIAVGGVLGDDFIGSDPLDPSMIYSHIGYVAPYLGATVVIATP